jgi:glycosyltransferase involved in cell wall biosynthesis
VVFQGDTDPRYLAEASKIVPDLLASDCVQFRDRVNWEQAWQLLWESDVLLLFQGSYTLQMPAKFYEYLQTGIPVLVVADEGALTDAVQATESGIWVQPGDPRAIADGLLRALEMPKHSPIDVRKRFSDRYDYGVLARQLSSWIRGLSNDK